MAMTLPQRQFLALVRLGTGTQQASADDPLFEGGLEWDAVHKLARQQGMVGFVTDGIGRLEGPAAPVEDDERLDPYLSDLLAIERRNHRLDPFVSKLTTRLEEDGLHPVVVKGQALAQLYPFPAHRESGDIDLLILPSEYPAAKAILLPKATKVSGEVAEILHQGMFFGKIEVELHGSVATLMSPGLDAKVNAMMEEELSSDRRETVLLDGLAVPVPSDRFNLVYVFVHFLHHYWSSGVGFRQLLDWAHLVAARGESVDRKQLRADLENLGLLHLWQVFAGFAVEHFGMDPAKMPLYKKIWRCKNRRIARFIFRCGNFGKALGRDERDKSKESYAGRKWRSFWQLVIRDRLQHIGTFPCASLRFFFGATRYGLLRLTKGE